MAEAALKALMIYGIVIAVSIMTAVLIHAIVVVLGRIEKPAPSMASTKAATPNPVDENGIGPDIVAAITAAVQMMARDYHIVHIEDQRMGAGWVAEGRNAHHASHAVEHHPRRAGSPTKLVKR